MHNSYLFILLGILIIQKINCNDVLTDSNIPCGLRYNDPLLNQTNSFRIGNPMGRLFVKSKALDDQTGNSLAIKRIQLINRQKEQLSNLIARLAQFSGSFDSKTNDTFNRLLKDSRALFQEKNDLKINNVSKNERSEIFKSLIIRSVNDGLESSEVSNLFNQSRTLIGQIEKNMKIKTRIIGGRKGNSKEFPWLVSIQAKGIGHVCGGCIISKDFVLTASHCVVDQNNKLYDRTYSVTSGSSFWRKGQVHQVVRAAPHPEFSALEFKNDVAILKVSPPFDLKKGRVKPICLPPKDAEAYGAATIAGWGVTSRTGAGPASEFIMRANIELLNDSICQSRYANYNSNQMICAGKLTGEKDSCQGDSGGPLQSLLPNGRVYVIGVVSFGDECGKANFPGVYSKQSKYVDWIYRTCEKLSK